MMNYGISGIGMGYGMGMMGMSGGNVHQSFKSQYGCEDCFRKEPYWVECPIAVKPVPNEVINPPLISKIKRMFLGG